MTDKKMFSIGMDSEDEEATLSFAGCGFLGIYHVGVASCIKQYAPYLFEGKIAGASAGALVACGLIAGCCLGDATSWTLRLATKARAKTLGPFNPSFDIVKLIRDGMDEVLPENAHKIVSGRLFISLTEAYTMKNVIVSHYDTKEELLDALTCTSFVPLWSGIIPPLYKGKRYIDGGISDNIPLLNKNTITVSPFAGESDICPKDNSENLMNINLANTSIQFTMGNMYRFTHALLPPEPEVLSGMCQQGFSDALKYLQMNNVIKVSKTLSIHSSIQKAVPIEGEDEHWEAVHPKNSQKSLEHREQCRRGSCKDCEERRMSIVNGLSPAVITALQAACDSVNQSLLRPLYRLKVYQALALLVAPYTVPVDLFTSLAKKFYYWAPYMPTDFRWFVYEFYELIKHLVHYLQQRRKQYSARFTCELAITEMEFNQAAAEHLTQSTLVDTLVDTQVGPHTRHNMNVGFSLDFQSEYHTPLQKVDDLRHHLAEDEKPTVHKLKASTPSSVALDLQADPEEVANAELADIATADTFEQCLNIANQMDSILAYHYVDEHNPGVTRVTEIFGLESQNRVAEMFGLESQNRVAEIFGLDSQTYNSDIELNDFIEFRAENQSVVSLDEDVEMAYSHSKKEFSASSSRRLKRLNSVTQLTPIIELAGN